MTKRIVAVLFGATLALGTIFGGIHLDGGVHLDNAQAGGIHLHR